ncbi:sensor domain-containing diguanylate cyclase [Zavarzinia compransoris]|uniref:sensor domain-containing diguanylate cyclase n=1 Tax=Zavarzinia marina TaxID=2911065 RepID=UPI001F2963CA|nr:sensor domain-containing diguanylate cyclase [Zavarzinia marina]MCF4166692.1 sensor domain-containing diguanylate cyclase [Zavarzinia marina]
MSGIESGDDAGMFDLAPVSLWLEDFSAVRRLFDDWRAAGVTDLAAHLAADPARVRACAERIVVLKVNARTLRLFEAADLAELTANLGRIFRDDMLDRHAAELTALWQGRTEFLSHSVNYSLSGRRIDIQMTGRVLPGHEESLDRVLIAIEDVTARETARREAAASENYARGLFEHSPVSLWVEDFSSIKRLLDEVRERGIEDFRVFTDVHPEFVQRCMSEIRVLDVNRQTLEMFMAPDRATLLRRLGDVFRDDMERTFREQLIDLWHGKLFQQREVVNYALNGNPVHVLLQLSVLPGHEDDWSLVQVALTDITARKKAEAYLEYLGTHDVLTKLYNRSFYTDELNRIERSKLRPVTVILADLNGLKVANDTMGHAVGDGLLRRAGEVLGKVVEKPSCAARIGGDEFVLLLPGVDAHGAKLVMEEVERLTDLNNQFYPGTRLSLAMGVATSLPDERLEDVVRRADAAMYEAKRDFYGDLAQEA